MGEQTQLDPKLKEACQMLDTLVKEFETKMAHPSYRISTAKIDATTEWLNDVGYYNDVDKTPEPKR